MRETEVTRGESSESKDAVSESVKPAQAREAIDELKRLRKGVTLGGLSWKALRDEGRK